MNINLPFLAFFLTIQGANGVTCVKTNKAVLVGYYDEGIQAGDCNGVVENLANYLISTNYVSFKTFSCNIS